MTKVQSQPMSAEEETVILQARGDLAVQNRNYWQEEAERRADQIAALVKALEECQQLLAVLINPQNHPNTSTLQLWAQATALECEARTLLSHRSAKT